jgi:hypothetical protein
LQHNPIPLPADVERGANPRVEVALICEVRQGTRPWAKVRLEDISQAGFKIAWLPFVSPKVPLKVRIPGLEMLTAEIRWQNGKAVGCSFIEPLHIAVFEHIARQAALAGRR